MSKYYQDPLGNEYHESYTNKHHLIFPESHYRKTEQLQRYRGLGGFVIRMTLESHRELHENVEPPIKPSVDLMWNIIANQRGNESNPYARLNDTIDFLMDIVFLDGPQSSESALLINNLARQRQFIDIGRVVLLST